MSAAPPSPVPSAPAPAARLDWIDAAKGIAILLVVVGHTVTGVSRTAIYSFHMPLFFILGAMTARWSLDRPQLLARVRKAFRRLILPALAMYALLMAITLWKFSAWYSVPARLHRFFWQKFLALLFVSGSKVSFAGTTVESVGILWFFPALFFGRSLFDALHLALPAKRLWAACLLLSLAGVAVSRFLWLPLSLDVVLAILPFFLFGACVSVPDSSPRLRRAISWTLLWAVSFFVPFAFGFGHLEISARIYQLYPLCFLPAVAGTMAVSEWSVWLVRTGPWTAPLVFLGRHSIWMLCIHVLDRRLFAAWWDFPGRPWTTLAARLLVNLLVFALVMALWTATRRLCRRLAKIVRK